MADSTFRDLIVWQRSITLVQNVYACTAGLPKSELYGLVMQMRRSAVSVPSNIAEGKKRGTRKDFVQFLRIAAGSAGELETQLVLVSKLYPEIELSPVTSDLEEVQKMLSVLISKLTKAGA
jgi:four helix bundle protein